MFVPTRHHHSGTEEESYSDFDHIIYGLNGTQYELNGEYYKYARSNSNNVSFNKIDFDFAQFEHFSRIKINGCLPNNDVFIEV